MKRNLLQLIAILWVTLASAQNTVPNGGFENWASPLPNDWTFPLLPGPDTIFKPSTNAHSGLLAAYGHTFQLQGSSAPFPLQIGNPQSGVGFVIGQESAYLSFYYIFNDNNSGDKMHVACRVYDVNFFQIGQLDTVVPPAATYTQAIFPISYTTLTSLTGSCQIGFQLRDANGSLQVDTADFFYLDDVTIPGYAGFENLMGASKGISVYPQPASDIVNITFNKPVVSNQHMNLYDVNGKEIDFENLQNIKSGTLMETIDVSNLNNGIYFLRSDDGSISSKLMVTH